jgi:site-specific recombinase XerD
MSALAAFNAKPQNSDRNTSSNTICVSVPALGALARPATLAAQVPVFLDWFRFVRRRSENTVKSYGFDLGTFLAFAQQAELVHAQDVSYRHLEFYLGWLQTARGTSARTANRHLWAVRAFWRWLTREGLATTNPAADTFTLPEHRALPRYLSRAERTRVLRTLAAREDLLGRRDYALVAAAFYTGLRCSELAALRLADVDLEAGVLRVLHGKGARPRELPVVPRLVGILDDYLGRTRPALTTAAHGELFFVRVHSRYGRTSRRAGQALGGKGVFWIVRHAVSPILGRDVHPHMLRHSFASHLRENGADLQIIQEALGHASINTTTMYAHLATPARRQKLAELLEEE